MKGLFTFENQNTFLLKPGDLFSKCVGACETFACPLLDCQVSSGSTARQTTKNVSEQPLVTRKEFRTLRHGQEDFLVDEDLDKEFEDIVDNMVEKKELRPGVPMVKLKSGCCCFVCFFVSSVTCGTEL